MLTYTLSSLNPSHNQHANLVGSTYPIYLIFNLNKDNMNLLPPRPLFCQYGVIVHAKS